MTVVSACLGLLMAGVPAAVQAHQVITVSPDGLHSGVEATVYSSIKASKSQTRKRSATSTLPFLAFASRNSFQSTQLRYVNDTAFINRNQLILVTRLPRAGLPALSAEQPAAI